VISFTSDLGLGILSRTNDSSLRARISGFQVNGSRHRCICTERLTFPVHTRVDDHRIYHSGRSVRMQSMDSDSIQSILKWSSSRTLLVMRYEQPTFIPTTAAKQARPMGSPVSAHSRILVPRSFTRLCTKLRARISFLTKEAQVADLSCQIEGDDVAGNPNSII
jgi:hypothetical protein